MIRLKETDIKENESIQRVEFEKQIYYAVSDVAKYLNEDLSDVKVINLLDKPFATLDDINKGRKREELSDFNKALLKAKHFKK